MKKFYLVMLMAIVALSVFAGAKEEALESLENAKQLIQKENYSKAQDELMFVQNKLSEIQAGDLEQYLPEAPAGYTVGDKSAQGMGQLFGGGNTQAASATYTKDDETLNLTITVGGLLGKTAGLAAMGQMFGGFGGASGSKTVRIAGYNGTQEYDKKDKSGTLTVQVGEKVSITVEGSEISDPEVMKTLIEKIDLAKLEKAF